MHTGWTTPIVATAAVTGRVLPPMLVIGLCVLAGFATFLALPSRRGIAIARVGGVLALIAAAALGAYLVHFANGYGHGGMGTYFWLFSAVAIFGAFRVITHRKPVYSALYFVLTVMASAGLFVLCWADFMAAALVIIYAGAILVTYVFVIMLATQVQAPDTARPAHAVANYDTTSRDPHIAAVVGFLLTGVLLFVIFDKSENAVPAGVTPPVVSTQYDTSVQALGLFLMTDQVVNLELAGLILTVAMVGAIVIARRRIVTTDGVQEMVETTAIETLPPLPRSNTYDDPHSIPVYGTLNGATKAYPES